MHPYARTDQWTFGSKLNPGYQPTMWLGLEYELDYSAISDDYIPEETEAGELWDLWVRELGRVWAKRGNALPAGHVPISWFVTGPTDGGDSVFEGAPFAPGEVEDFLTHYTWPRHAAHGRSLQFSRLEVLDRGWRIGQPNKGGFIQEVTGWKPTYLQDSIDVVALANAARVRAPKLPD